MQKENEVVESAVKEYIGQGCYPIGESQYGKLYAEVKNSGYNQFTIRVIISPEEDNVHNRFKEVGLLSDIAQINISKDQINFETLEAAHNWLEQFASERQLIRNWT